MFIKPIDFFTVLANFLQVVLEIGVVLRVTEPAHERVFLRNFDGHQGARVESLLEQRAKLINGLLLRRCGRTEIRNTQDLSGKLPCGFMSDLNEAG